jgi:uncharacterized protein (TIGR01777 family)
MPKVIISGGSGLIGQTLCRRLQDQGYDVAILSRKKGAASAEVNHHIWDSDRQIIDAEAINNCDYIIHLAGVNIGAGRWTQKRKQAIADSRIKSARLILDNIDRQHNSLKAFISASAIGIYGAKTTDKILTETDPPANDFLGQTCEKWEQAADGFSDMGIRTVKIRTGIVLSKKGGALAKLLIPVKLGIGSALGSGKQYMPWIHLDDLCGIYIHAMEKESMTGPYNAVAPEHTTNQAFTRKLAHALHKPFWFPKIPSLILRILFGKMSAMLLTGSRISSERIQAAGYQFRFPDLEDAFMDLYSKYKES